MHSNGGPDPYRELGVEMGADLDTIRQAYRDLALLYHPDHAPDGQAEAYEERMKRINAAYALLSDPDRRSKYDLLRKTGATTIWTPDFTGSSNPSRSVRDPYTHFRYDYHHRVHRIRKASKQLPLWAQVFSGLFAAVGFVAGFLIGLLFGGIGCLPGAVIGFLLGGLIGVGLVYLLILLVPAALGGWFGYTAAEQTGLIVGAVLGLAAGLTWLVIQRKKK
jgi:hypothetical protein